MTWEEVVLERKARESLKCSCALGLKAAMAVTDLCIVGKQEAPDSCRMSGLHGLGSKRRTKMATKKKKTTFGAIELMEQ